MPPLLPEACRISANSFSDWTVPSTNGIFNCLILRARLADTRLEERLLDKSGPLRLLQVYSPCPPSFPSVYPMHAESVLRLQTRDELWILEPTVKPFALRWSAADLVEWCCGPHFLGSESSPPAAPQERRLMRRFDMRLPALVRLAGSTDELLTETQNVSARGVFFYMDREIAEGTRVEMTLTLPPHITLTDSVRVRFIARIIRVEKPLPVSRVGMAAMIEEYEFLRSNPLSRLQ
jgi:hypothetical protein